MQQLSRRRRPRWPVLAGSLVLQGLVAAPALAQPAPTHAATWRTWVLATPSQLRLPPPPDATASAAERDQLRALAAARDDAAPRIAWWSAAAPAYRWNQIAVEAALRANLGSNFAARHLAVLHTALADGMVAAWDSKYAHNRPPPNGAPPSAIPSYPDEHAAAGAIAAAILGAIFPQRQAEFAAMAEEAGRMRLLAGAAYPSDVAAGTELGRRVAALALERAAADGFAQPWRGTVPTGPGLWSGTNPAAPQAATWRPWVLASPSEIRPPAPPAHDSPERAAEMAALRAFVRTPKSDADARFWDVAVGGLRNYQFWGAQVGRLLMEHGLAQDAPRAARAYAMVQVAMHDSGVACWDAKYTYWTLRPHQYDTTYRPLFTVANHPSFPSAHSCFSAAAAGVMTALFPRETAPMAELVREAGQARIWGGLHYESDITAGNAIGHAVAARVIARARADGDRLP